MWVELELLRGLGPEVGHGAVEVEEAELVLQSSEQTVTVRRDLFRF